MSSRLLLCNVTKMLRFLTFNCSILVLQNHSCSAGQLRGSILNTKTVLSHLILSYLSFRSPVNNDVNKTLLNNVRALDGMEKIPTNSIESKLLVLIQYMLWLEL